MSPGGSPAGRDGTRLPKLLTLLLRHDPGRFGLVLDPGGWVEVTALLAALARHGWPLTGADLEALVAADDKQRFAVEGGRIRANQGHSVPVDLGLAPRRPPERLYHGTPRTNLAAILRTGLHRAGRHAVHPSTDVASADRVGARRGRPVVLDVEAGRTHRDGHVFTRSRNGIWLVAEVPPAYLSVLESRGEEP